ncbi:hypothetical protein Vadar_008562 [Vaccinium darrowii]|uniref:Uncharacterized protein n=1 Tax=Vaccinium darrowii TaxID=229202 RepID=A0ACB7YL88_9ERIC|nr:hypothetical protein Vadar_008562 [Vaccinium darrowii]
MEISCRLEFLPLPPKYLALEDDGFPPKIFMADKNPFPHSPVLSLAISVSSPLISDDPFSSILLSSCDGAFNKMKKKRYHISTTENRSEPTNSVGASQSSDASQHPLSHGSSLPVQQGNDYERARIENIQRNNEELRSRGMREIPIPSMDVVQHNPVNENVNENGKRMRVDVDDNDYRLAHSHGVSRPYQSRSASRAEPHVPLQDPSPNFSQPQLAEDGFDMGDELDGENEVGIRDESGKPNKRGITHLSDIWNMPPGSRIVVKFNAALRPVGQEGIVFNRFIGTVKKMEDLRTLQQRGSEEKPKGQLVWSKDDIYSQVINKKEHPGCLRGMGFGYTSTNNGSTYDIARRFNMTSEEERMQDKETICDLQEKLEANNQQLEANNQQMDTMASEMNFLRTQVDFLLRHFGLQLQDGVSGTRDQASPQTHQGSSFASHEIEPRGNRQSRGFTANC